jgi:hypothetical protein
MAPVIPVGERRLSACVSPPRPVAPRPTRRRSGPAQRHGAPLTGLPVNQLGPLMWDDPITETPKVGTTERWMVINATPDK